MDIFVRNVPRHATNKDVRQFFLQPLSEFGITVFHCEKMWKSKHLATITVLDVTAAQRFLDTFGTPPHAPPSIRPLRQLKWNGNWVRCSKSDREPSNFSVKSLAYEANQRAASAVAKSQRKPHTDSNKALTRFNINGLECGLWEYNGSALSFVSHFSDSRGGTITFGAKETLIILGEPGADRHRLDMAYAQCENIVLETYEHAVVTFTLQYSPRIYTVSALDELTGQFTNLLGVSNPAARTPVQKTRITSINSDHQRVVGLCYVYRVCLADYRELGSVRSLLQKNPRVSATVSTCIPTQASPETIDQSMVKLEYKLTDSGRYGRLPFPLRYQILRLARNGILHPATVVQLLPRISALYSSAGLDAITSSVRVLGSQTPMAGPETDAHALAIDTLSKTLEVAVGAYDGQGANNPYAVASRFEHIQLIHRIIITPTGHFLEGPDPEPTNRVLRRYGNYRDHFIRVIFQDEDGGSVRYDSRADQSKIFTERFKTVLDTSIAVASLPFSFLGFSHSSLRSQACWFMAPFVQDGENKYAPIILKELGDFSNIKIPAKCAARIGQNFTDTVTSIDISRSSVIQGKDIERNGRNFSDGCGTISSSMLDKVWKVYGPKRQPKPTALQFRYKGIKGMLSLDTRLPGDSILLRPSMRKFETGDEVCNLEICGAALKPLPLILNRPLIKLLEDLGVSRDTFLSLQQDAMDKLKCMTTSPTNTITFLKETSYTTSSQLPSLIQLLGYIGLDYRQDKFLYSVVEIAVVTKLRDIKYRGRIPVPHGYTLYGIVDETGILLENEVYVPIVDSSDGGRKVIVQDRVAITRSPAMHPGDVQIVNAVDVRSDSPLRTLSNVAVFSQHGARDLPSKLSGGDLDGDLYNLILDNRLVPTVTYEPADYPRVSAAELNRPVTLSDMSDFLVKFMQSDRLGMISTAHLQVADQKELGTLDPDCIILAGLASTAVDYSKTGIPVDMSTLPKYDRCKPDFMSPSPRVLVSEKGVLELEEEAVAEDEAFQGLDAEQRPTRYYRSDKVLGELYRDIDENQFLADMQREQQLARQDDDLTYLFMHRVWSYFRHWSSQYLILYDHHKGLARQIRDSYEESLLTLLYEFAPSPHLPVSEQEAFAGTILGRQNGPFGKPLRELSKLLRERVNNMMDYATMRIIKGDQVMNSLNDLDELYDDDTYDRDREIEALPRALACLAVACEEHGFKDKRLGELQSFQYIAAGVALREWERYLITTSGTHTLPRVDTIRTV